MGYCDGRSQGDGEAAGRARHVIQDSGGASVAGAVKEGRNAESEREE